MAKSKSPESVGPAEDKDKVATEANADDKTATDPDKDAGLPEPDKSDEPEIADTPQPDSADEPVELSEPGEIIATEEVTAPNDDAAEDDTPEEVVTPEETPTPNEYPAAPSTMPAVAPERSSSGFWPLVLGGMVAACLGFVAGKSQIIDPILPSSWRSAGENTETAANVEAMGQTVSQLRNEIEELRSQIPDAPTDNSDTLNTLSASVEELVARTDALEQRPQPPADGASNVDVSALTDQMATQQEQIDKLLKDARLIQESATAAAGTTLARAAATRVLAAVDSGSPFATALADVSANSDVDVPVALSRVADDGVTPLPDLQQALPDAARAALAAARTNATDETGGFGGFLRRQLGARSVQPREGTDPDAVLSRVEEATRQGHLADALAEAETLPDPAKAELQSWMDAAQARLEAMNAAEALIQRLAAN
ncbi:MULTISPECIES: hypothetical protein [Roseobacteraceae]|uniref:Mitochondrial inner membrane protein n=1 Tax=Pseudosulfitobacter pseudonitzschiae TaxID=1402135 RepID=A0A221K4T2_9RHOB|nr:MULTISPECIES: hypothetical protein [Roseobacteraceae]ASM73999.1 hypothetical protein SULPSESMR1_03222 [Pseudosulfitobacter pseudonitzschiae]